jgi:hypothetical protein
MVLRNSNFERHIVRGHHFLSFGIFAENEDENVHMLC